jgi:DNA-binding NtrC family response regulator
MLSFAEFRPKDLACTIGIVAPEGLAVQRPINDERCRTTLNAARILLVEDSFFILMELESALLDAGAEAVCCRSVGEALSTLDAQPVSAAVLDVQLDRETSEAVAERLVRRGIPFLFYTGQREAAPMHDDWPACRILSKPAPRETIVAAVADLLER